MKVMLYPQVNTAGAGPSNVVFYLSAELKKHVQIFSYPSFHSSIQKASFGDYAAQFFRVWGASLSHDFDIAHFIMLPELIDASFPLALFTKVANFPLILNIHGIIHLEQSLLKTPFQKALIKKVLTFTLCKNASRIVVNSSWMFRKINEWYGVPPEKVVVIPNGINLKMFQGPTEKEMMEGDPCILFVGSFIYPKGVDTLIKAIAIAKRDLPHIKLHVVGNSKYLLPSLRSLIAKEAVENNIFFHGWVSQSELPRYYKSADFCVFPSRLESFGIVVLEAMASGIPIIASDIDTFRERLTEGSTALFFQNNKPEDLSRAILKLASDSNLRRQLSKNSLETIQMYNWSNIVSKYLEIYQNVSH
jgi:glycosyltransferase involved in cell wall biosynthesis